MPELRKLIRTKSEGFRPYNRYGISLKGLQWLPLSKEEMNQEIYLIRFEPGSQSHRHVHDGSEQFLVLDGDLTDDDGVVFKTGDFVRFEPGSEHSSYSEHGCTLLVILTGGRNRLLP